MIDNIKTIVYHRTLATMLIKHHHHLLIFLNYYVYQVRSSMVALTPPLGGEFHYI